MISSITLWGSLDGSENYGTMTLHIRSYQDIIIIVVVRGEEIISYHHEHKIFFCLLFLCFVYEQTRRGSRLGKSSLRELHKAGSCSFGLLFQHPRIDIEIVS